MDGDRINTVSLVKAIGIILMVLGHVLATWSTGWNVIYAFHMPLFFLMSGYCFKEKYLDNARQFILRKIKGVYLPFVLFSLSFLALHNVFCSWYFYEPDWLYGWKDFAWNIGRIITRMSHNEGLLGTFWFLKELLLGNVVFFFLLKGLKDRIIPSVIGLLAIAEMLCIFNLRIPYFNVTSDSVFAAFFIAFGFLWKTKEWRLNKWWIWVMGVGFLVAELIWSPKIGMLGNTPISMIYYAIPAIGTTMMVYEVGRWMESGFPKSALKVIHFIGDHSLAIMALHFTAFKLVSLGYLWLHELPMIRLTEFPVLREFANTGGAILYVLIGVLLPLLMAWLWKTGKCKIESLMCKEYEKKESANINNHPVI